MIRHRRSPFIIRSLAFSCPRASWMMSTCWRTRWASIFCEAEMFTAIHEAGFSMNFGSQMPSHCTCFLHLCKIQFDTICTCCKADGRSWLEKYGCKVEFQAVKRLGGEVSGSNNFNTFWESGLKPGCHELRAWAVEQLHWSVSMSDVVGNSACSSRLPLLRTLDHYENSHEEIAWNFCWH